MYSETYKSIFIEDDVDALSLMYKSYCPGPQDYSSIAHPLFLRMIYDNISKYHSCKCFGFIRRECVPLLKQKTIKVFERNVVMDVYVKRPEKCLALLQEGYVTPEDISSLSFLFVNITEEGWKYQKDILLWLLQYPSLLDTDYWTALSIVLLCNCDVDLRNALSKVYKSNVDYDSLLLKDGFLPWDSFNTSSYYRSFCKAYYTNIECKDVCISNNNILLLTSRY